MISPRGDSTISPRAVALSPVKLLSPRGKVPAQAARKQDRPDVPNMRAHSGPARWGPTAIAAEPIAAEPIATERFPHGENPPSLRAERLAQVVHYPRGRGQVARCRRSREESWIRLRTPALSRFPVEAVLSPSRAVPTRAARKQDRLSRKHSLGRAEFTLSVSRRSTQAFFLNASRKAVASATSAESSRDSTIAGTAAAPSACLPLQTKRA